MNSLLGLLFHDPIRSNQQSVDHDDEDDEQLRIAIALSHEEARETKRARREGTPEDYKCMLAEAIAASLAEAGPSTNPETSVSQQPAAAIATPTVAPVVEASSSLRIGSQTYDRAQMNRERLERQAARDKAEAKQPRREGIPTFEQTSSRRPQARKAASAQWPPLTGIHPFQGTAPFPRDAAGEYYVEGELRHTGNMWANDNSAGSLPSPTPSPTFSLTHVIGDHSQISLIIASAFCIDDSWLSEAGILPDPIEVPVVMIRPYPKDLRHRLNGKVISQINGEVWCYPDMKDNWGTMHMKFFWIFYKTGRLRTVFVQDFLPLDTPLQELSTDDPTHDLAVQFRTLFKHIGVDSALMLLSKNHPQGHRLPFSGRNNFADLRNWDWGKVRFRTVISVSEKVSGASDMNRFGIGRLGHVLNTEGWVPDKEEKAIIEYQGSSLGQYSLNWLHNFYSFCTGKNISSLMTNFKASSWPPIKIIFPSLNTVDSSVGGRDGGGTIFAGKGWNANTKDLFYDSNSKRGGILMHAKMMIAIFHPKTQISSSQTPSSTSLGKRKALEMDVAEKKIGGWVYVGSHNFSPAAWGTLDTKKSPVTLSIKNYELGIVFPLYGQQSNVAADKVAPYKRPPKKYSVGDEPWDQKKHGIGL
ncbi:tyrosyl-DNA phosphodiesterase 1 [Cryptococcus gattii NT-10]|nr:tyrosyl-DNA phosphodiesterase 1 [Cryptococcus gattii NT-10]